MNGSETLVTGNSTTDVKWNDLSKEVTVEYVLGDAMDQYDNWPSPSLIISDGPYGVSGYKGDLHTFSGLAEWYEPHIKNWTEKSNPAASLWFWNSEIGWATVHPILEKYGWEYKSCCIWNKGIGHIAGNCNTKTISTFPVVTEVCVHYVKKPFFYVDNKKITMQEWMISEWKRSGLPLKKANIACGVADAASRKWLTKDHLWYMPSSDSIEKRVKYANEHGYDNGKPYFSINGVDHLTKGDWDRLLTKFNCPIAKTNVWEIPQLKTEERIRVGRKAVHNNQKPLQIIKELISASSNPQDVIWDPFGGLATTAVACIELRRNVFSSEINENMYRYGSKRINDSFNQFL